MFLLCSYEDQRYWPFPFSDIASSAIYPRSRSRFHLLSSQTSHSQSLQPKSSPIPIGEKPNAINVTHSGHILSGELLITSSILHCTRRTVAQTACPLLGFHFALYCLLCFRCRLSIARGLIDSTTRMKPYVSIMKSCLHLKHCEGRRHHRTDYVMCWVPTSFGFLPMSDPRVAYEKDRDLANLPLSCGIIHKRKSTNVFLIVRISHNDLIA